jgi:hypothetical protein
VSGALQGRSFSEEVAAAEGALTLARRDGDRLAADNRGLLAQLRAKDRQLDSLALRAQEVEALLLRNKARLPAPLWLLLPAVHPVVFVLSLVRSISDVLSVISHSCLP